MPYDATRNSLFHPGLADDFFLPRRPDTDIALCAEMARLAYVKETGRLEIYLERAGFEVGQAVGYARGGTQAFVAHDQANKITVVAFRGTEPDDPSDLFTDAKFAQDDWADATGNPIGKVHTGFAAASRELEHGTEVFRKLKNLIDPVINSHHILLTGHSLGAALATLMASWLPSAHLYTFGSPRVGNAAFAQSIKNPVMTRVVNCCDLVTRIPPESGFGFNYQHIGAFVYIDRNGNRLESPSDSTITADRFAAAAHYLVHHAFFRGTVFSRDLADHAPINYVSGVMGTRVSG
jgi:Lipase (class 3)